ncbi:hypothetical protein HHI36_011264 [Cryptolaemus montrouzieri]|uniref:Uncharacterized protein n=1 Tax=Cryptolaemus montrouzieri TaxID=559131 RepID=A0ABD2MLK1_9CUCU
MHEKKNNEDLLVNLRNISDQNLEKVKVHLSQLDWAKLYCKCADTGFFLFVDCLREALDLYVPPFVLNAIHIKMIGSQVIEKRFQGKNLRNPFRLCKLTGDINLLESYKEEKKRHKNFIELKNREYDKNVIASSENRTKSVWRMVGCTLGGEGRTQSIKKVVKEGNTINNPSKIADLFADFFSKKTECKLREHFGNDRPKTCTSRTIIEKTFLFSPIADKYVKFVLRNLKNT